MEKYFTYLDWLRQTGITNMCGARPYLQRAFSELENDPSRAREILRAWMNECQRKGDGDKC